MSEEQGVQLTDKEKKINKLRIQLEEVMSKREELQAELSTMTTIAVKLQGAIEVLEEMVDESNKKEEEKSD